ncbi:MAG: lanthionine synthetase C family protein [Bacteroidales bacterium]
MNWQPLIGKDHDLYLPIRNKLKEISSYLQKIDDNDIIKKDGFSLLGGASGNALFLLYYGAAFEEEKSFNKGLSLVESIFAQLGSGSILDTHAGGLSGVAYMLELLAQEGFIDCDTNEILGDCDQILYDSMINNLEQNDNWDFLHGALGSALYFLNRKSSPKAEEYLGAFLESYERLATKDKKGGLKWKSPVFPDETRQIWVYNYSLAHGMAATIGILGKIIQRFPNLKLAQSLLDQLLEYYEHTKNMFTANKSLYPGWIPLDSEEEISKGNRVAWCYGDPGIGIAMLIAAKCTNNLDLEKRAVELLDNSLSRTSYDDSGIRDACMCHGSSSLLQIYNRAYGIVRKKEYKDYAMHWLAETLKLMRNDKFPLGYSVFKLDGYYFEMGLLEGVSGAGLALLASIVSQEPTWDESLLIS